MEMASKCIYSQNDSRAFLHSLCSTWPESTLHVYMLRLIVLFLAGVRKSPPPCVKESMLQYSLYFSHHALRGLHMPCTYFAQTWEREGGDKVLVSRSHFCLTRCTEVSNFDLLIKTRKRKDDLMFRK